MTWTDVAIRMFTDHALGPLTAREVHALIDWIDERPDLLGAVMKSPGPFFQRRDGSFLADGELPDPAPYRAALAGIPVFELSGAIDFARAAQHCLGFARS